MSDDTQQSDGDGVHEAFFMMLVNCGRRICNGFVHRDSDAIAAWMVERVHRAGRLGRDELLKELIAEFGPRDGLDRELMNAFRATHRGTVRWTPNGAVWESTGRKTESLYGPASADIEQSKSTFW